MDRHVRKVIREMRELRRPPFRVNIVVEASHGMGFGYGGEPRTELKYEIVDRSRGFREISANLVSFDGDGSESIKAGVQTAKDIALAVGKNYKPRGYVLVPEEDTNRFVVWPCVTREYSTGFYLESQKKRKV